MSLESRVLGSCSPKICKHSHCKMDKLTLGFSEIKNERGLFVEIRILFTYLVFADERLEQAKREGEGSRRLER